MFLPILDDFLAFNQTLQSQTYLVGVRLVKFVVYFATKPNKD